MKIALLLSVIVIALSSMYFVLQNEGKKRKEEEFRQQVVSARLNAEADALKLKAEIRRGIELGQILVGMDSDQVYRSAGEPSSKLTYPEHRSVLREAGLAEVWTYNSRNVMVGFDSSNIVVRIMSAN
jgi:hypothetical protein